MPTKAQIERLIADVRGRIGRLNSHLAIGQFQFDPNDPRQRRQHRLYRLSDRLSRALVAKLRPEREAEAARREVTLRESMDEDARRVAALSVWQRRNGWEIVKDGIHYVLRHPESLEEARRYSNLKRIREAADESGPW